MNRRERYPANSIFGNSKDTKESTVPIIIIIVIIIIIIIIIITIIIYLALWTDPEWDSCFIIYQMSWIKIT